MTASSVSQTPPPVLSIVVPTFKEADNLPLLLAEIRDALQPAAVAYEVLVVDDHSPDATVAVCETLVQQGHPLRLIVRTTERGLSSAVIRGLDEAAGDYLACMDADLSHPPSALPTMLRQLQAGHGELVIGSRYVPGGATDADWGLFRWLNSKIATLLALPFSGGARDPMAGFFMLPRAVYARHAPLNAIGYKILLELICKCRPARVLEVPIHFRDRRLGQSKLSIREQVRYLQHLYRLCQFKYRLFHELTHFSLVGASGVVVDLTVVHLSYHGAHATMPVARFLGIAVALVWNFFLNRRYTFGGVRERQPIGWQFAKFALSCSLGAGINWLTSVACFTAVPWFAGRLARCAILGIGAGMGFNFLLSKHFVFKSAGGAGTPPGPAAG